MKKVFKPLSIRSQLLLFNNYAIRVTIVSVISRCFFFPSRRRESLKILKNIMAYRWTMALIKHIIANEQRRNAVVWRIERRPINRYSIFVTLIIIVNDTRYLMTFKNVKIVDLFLIKTGEFLMSKNTRAIVYIDRKWRRIRWNCCRCGKRN